MNARAAGLFLVCQEDSANLEEPDLIAAEIAEDLRAALAEFEAIQAELTITG